MGGSSQGDQTPTVVQVKGCAARLGVGGKGGGRLSGPRLEKQMLKQKQMKVNNITPREKS